MDQQQNTQRQGDPWIDGYIAQMFGPQDAQNYHVSLLGGGLGQIQFQAGTADPDTGIFLATPPPGQSSGQHNWVIDHLVRDNGPVIRQKLWAPKNTSDKSRWVDHEQLHPSVFFIHKNGQDLGLPLEEAAGGNCMRLRGAEAAAPVDSRAHAQIRINWSGYEHLDWNKQISIQRQTQPRETVSLEKFAMHVARKTLQFMEAAKDKLDDSDDQRYHIGDNYITPRHIILIGAVQVSHGSWMPILQLNNGYLQCL